MFIELQEQSDEHVAPRRLYVNVNAIAYVAAKAGEGTAVIVFCCEHSSPAIPIDETFETVRDLIDAAVSTSTGC